MYRFFAFWICFSSALAQASVQFLETDNYKKVYEEILQASKKTAPEDLLVVFDIDKTLLIVEECLDSENSAGFRGWLRKVWECPAYLTEENLVKGLASLQRLGIGTMALTARGSNIMDPTERELARNQISFLGMPYGEEDNFKEGSLVFKDGVTFANNRNKGNTLKLLMERLQPSYQQIVFVDDDKKNIRHMKAAYEKDRLTHVKIIHYTRYDD